MNNSFENMTGFSREVINQHFSVVISSTELQRSVAIQRQLLAGNNIV